MKKEGTYEYVMEQRSVDFTHRVTHTALMNYILQAAGDDADSNGFGLKDLNVGNCSWVLSRVCAEFGERPRQGDTVRFRTWVNEVGRLMTTRNMEVFDSAGTKIAASITQWAVIDLDTRHAVDIRANVDYHGRVSDEASPIDKPIRIRKVENDSVAMKRIEYSDIDFNGHMNAMKYVEWAIDHLPIESFTDRPPVRMDINFQKEAVLRQFISLHEAIEDNRHRFEIRESDSGEALCRIEFAF